MEWSSAASENPPPIADLATEAGDIPIHAVAHRVVHGGNRFSGPGILDSASLQAIAALGDLAPLHNASALAVIQAARVRYPQLPHVAVFDTAFHHDLPDTARLYAVPAHWHEQHGVRRFGFHGISHESVARQAAALLQRPLEELRLITLHLGNGASAAAIAGGRSVDTSMGMTPLEGLIMGSRSGDLDVAAALHAARREGLSLDQLEHTLLRDSGLVGLCGDSDLRTILARSDQGDTVARRAISLYCYRIRKYIGAYMAALGGLDALVFTGGVGENAPAIRAGSCEGLSALGITLDPDRNALPFTGQPMAVHADAGSLPVLVLPSSEDLEIARQTLHHLGKP